MNTARWETNCSVHSRFRDLANKKGYWLNNNKFLIMRVYAYRKNIKKSEAPFSDKKSF
jgi:hypothetical protein